MEVSTERVVLFAWVFISLCLLQHVQESEAVFSVGYSHGKLSRSMGTSSSRSWLFNPWISSGDRYDVPVIEMFGEGKDSHNDGDDHIDLLLPSQRLIPSPSSTPPLPPLPPTTPPPISPSPVPPVNSTPTPTPVPSAVSPSSPFPTPASTSPSPPSFPSPSSSPNAPSLSPTFPAPSTSPSPTPYPFSPIPTPYSAPSPTPPSPSSSPVSPPTSPPSSPTLPPASSPSSIVSPPTLPPSISPSPIVPSPFIPSSPTPSSIVSPPTLPPSPSPSPSPSTSPILPPSSAPSTSPILPPSSAPSSSPILPPSSSPSSSPSPISSPSPSPSIFPPSKSPSPSPSPSILPPSQSPSPSPSSSPSPSPSSSPTPSIPYPPSPLPPPPMPIPVSILANLTISGAELVPEFDPYVFNYTASFGAKVKRFYVTAYLPKDEEDYKLSLLYIENIPLKAGERSPPLKLGKRGENVTYKIFVKEIEHVLSTYVLSIYREAGHKGLGPVAIVFVVLACIVGAIVILVLAYGAYVYARTGRIPQPRDLLSRERDSSLHTPLVATAASYDSSYT